MYCHLYKVIKPCTRIHVTMNNFVLKGTCTCNSSYVGVDCSHAKTIPPSNLTLPDGGLCKNTKRPCKETNIFGYFQSETVFVKFERFEVR